jgi:nitroreductase
MRLGQLSVHAHILELHLGDGMTSAIVLLQELLSERHSCRAFLPRQVDDATITTLLETAQRTPSWCNTQPWNVIVTRGAATEAFSSAYSSWAQQHKPNPDFSFPSEYRGVHQERRRDTGWALYEAVGIARGDRTASREQAMKNYQFFGAPHVAIITTEDWFGPYGAVDCGGYITSILLAAAALRLGAVAQAALASHPELIRRHFGLPETTKIVCGISFGYEDTAHPANSFRTKRALLDEVVRLV